jgi:hypothetical protein
MTSAKGRQNKAYACVSKVAGSVLQGLSGGSKAVTLSAIMPYAKSLRGCVRAQKMRNHGELFLPSS